MTMKLGVVVVTAVVVAVSAFIIGILVGYAIWNENGEIIKEEIVEDSKIWQEMKKRMKSENIRSNLKFLSNEPHLAGSDRDAELANHVKARWIKDGLDEVKLVPYNVLLSYPNKADPNKVEIVDENGKLLFESQYKEKTLRQEDDHPDFVHSFNSYAAKGDVTGDLVYVNYGTVDDFQELKDRGIAVKGKICISRYGKIYRGNKVKHAEENGALGIILFLDPQDVAANGTNPENVYPNSLYMPGTAMQRGTVLQGNGDPTTPGYPSIDGIYRVPEEDLILPSIPSQPIGYSDAKEFLKIMDGPVGPKEWIGGLPISYNIGPGFKGEHKNKKVRLAVKNELRRENSYNVIGTIKGSIEPDRYVLIGNHRDAWGYGAVDALTGTSQLLEVSRVLGELHKEGWTPRRTIVFCSWGAEEFGLIGSYEWVEENLPQLQDRAVGYINVDICSSGDKLTMDASPLLHNVTWDVTKLVEHPIISHKSVYDVWKMYNITKPEPEISTPGSGSDHAPFTFYAGIPIVSMWWKVNKEKYNVTSTYPAYHTGYETFFLVDKFIDPGFKIHKSCAQISSLLLHRLSESLIIPYNAIQFAEVMKRDLQKLRKSDDLLKAKGLTLDTLEDKISMFRSQTEEWHEKLKNVDTKNPMMLRMINDQFMRLERAFIKPDGLPDHPLKRHMIFAPSQYDSYSGGGFPGLSDLLYGISKLSQQKQDERWKKIKKHMSDLLVVIHYATNILKPFEKI